MRGAGRPDSRNETRGAGRPRAIPIAAIAASVLASLLVSAAPASGCADCAYAVGDPDHPEFGYVVCFDNAQIYDGYLYCLTVGDRLCYFFGQCGGPGGPPVAGHAGLAVELMLYEPDEGDLRDLPLVVAASDIPSSRSAIARALGIRPEQVHLRDHAFVTGPADIPGHAAHALEVDGAGLLVGAAGETGGGAAVRLCSYGSGRGFGRTASASLGPGQVLIAALPVRGRQIVVAVRAYSAPVDRWQVDLPRSQSRFQREAALLREAPALGLHVATAPADCPP